MGINKLLFVFLNYSIKYCSMQYLLSILFVFISHNLTIAQTGQWLTKASLPTTRQEMPCALVNDKIYVVGGIGFPLTVHGINEAYDPVSDTWSTMTAAPAPRHHHAVAVIGSKMYVLGGYNTLFFSAVSENFVYDANTNQWDTIAPLPIPLGAVAAAVWNGKIYVFGGTNSNGVQNETLVYNPSDNTWTDKEPMPTPREHHAAVTIGDLIYVVSGRAFQNADITLEIYEPQQDAWTVAPSMPTGRSGIAATALGGKLFVFGGEGGRIFGENEMFDPLSNSWISMPDMPTPRHGLGAVAVGDSIIYIPGGATQEGLGPTNKHEAFKPENILSSGEHQMAHQVSLLFNSENSLVIIPSNESRKASISLYSSEGKILLQNDLKLESGKNFFSLKAYQISSGMYWLKLKTGNQTMSRTIFISE
jgi:N-acetylneuraminic acid mutarotase